MSSGQAMMLRVLIVEDECLVLCLAESVLQQAGYDTVLAATVAEAEAVINSDEKLDLVFTDMQLGSHVRCETLNLVNGNPAREVIAERIIAASGPSLQPAE